MTLDEAIPILRNALDSRESAPLTPWQPEEVQAFQVVRAELQLAAKALGCKVEELPDKVDAVFKRNAELRAELETLRRHEEVSSQD